MVVNTSGGSMTANLHEGATDGRYRKVAPNRGGIVEQTFRANREGLNPDLYDDILSEQARQVMGTDGATA